MVGHLVGNVNGWVIGVKIFVKLVQVELLLSVHHFLDRVAIIIS